jgi:predicted nucleic acid-binding protein
VTLVVDASAIGAILFGEPEADAVEHRMRGHLLVAPALIGLEVANMCVKRVRRAPERHKEVLAVLDVYARFRIREQEVEHAGVLRLAITNRLTAHDAAYLWLARHLGLPLVTLDARLGEAAQA